MAIGITRKFKGFTLLELLIVFVVVGIGAAFVSMYAGRFIVADGDAVRAAEAQGFSDVRIVRRHNFFASLKGCGGDDRVAFEVRGANAAGGQADVLVCCGDWFKGCTIRSR